MLSFLLLPSCYKSGEDLTAERNAGLGAMADSCLVTTELKIMHVAYDVMGLSNAIFT